MFKLCSSHVFLLWALMLAHVGGHHEDQEKPDGAPYTTTELAPPEATETDAPEPDGNTSLHLASQQGNMSAVQELLSSNASVNALNSQLRNPLHIAALRAAATCSEDSSCLDIPKLLIDAGADLYAKDRDDRTFLHLLLWLDTTLHPSQFQEMAEFLVLKNHTALFNLPGWKDSSTPFQLAVQAMEVAGPTLNLLHEHGVNFAAIDSDGDSVLSYALTGCRQRSWPFLNRLTRYGADIKHLNSRNKSFLHRAAYCGSRNNLHFFIVKQVDVNGVNDWKETPLHLVTKFAHKDLLGCVKLLVQHGADKEAKDRDWKTALDIAEERSDIHDREQVLRLLTPKSNHDNGPANDAGTSSDAGSVSVTEIIASAENNTEANKHTEASTITSSNQTATGNSGSSSLSSFIQPTPLLLLQMYMVATCFVLLG